eukprot:s2216_g5.t1
MSSADVAVSSAAADAVMDNSTIVTDDSDWDVLTATQNLQHEEDAANDFLHLSEATTEELSEELATQNLQHEEDAANDFLHLSEATTEELSEELRASMASLAETIAQLQVSAKDSKPDTMEVEQEPRAGLGYTIAEEMETEQRAGLGFSPAAQVPPALSKPVVSPAPAPPGFVRASQPTLTLSVRLVLDPENNAFSKLAAFPESFPSIPNYLIQLLQNTPEAEIVDLFSKFVHVPMTSQGVRRILEAYIPMKALCRQEAVWAMKSQKQHQSAGLGLSTLRPRPLGQAAYTHMCSACKSGWLEQATSCMMCKQGKKVAYEPPLTTFELNGAPWQLTPVDGKPTWVPMATPSSGAPGPVGGHSPISKVALSVDASAFAQAPGKTASLNEMTMADAVPLPLRMSLREEVLEQAPDKDAQMSSALLAEHKESVKKHKHQSFQVFHPEAAQALQAQAEVYKQSALRQKTAEEEAEAKRQKTEVITAMLDQNETFLQPFQEGLQEPSDSAILSPGVDLVRRSNLAVLRQKLQEQFLTGGINTLTALQQAQTTLEEARAANKQRQAAGHDFMKRHTLVPMDHRLPWSQGPQNPRGQRHPRPRWQTASWRPSGPASPPEAEAGRWSCCG